MANTQLFYDVFSERFFESTLTDVMSAEYKLNREIDLYGAYLNQFYEFLEAECGRRLLIQMIFWYQGREKNKDLYGKE